LRHAANQPEILHPNSTQALKKLGTAGILAGDQVDDLVVTLQMNQRIQSYLRLVNDGTLDVAKAPPSILLGLARASFPSDAPASLETIEKRVRERQARAASLYDELVDRPAKEAGWQGLDS
jgi:glutamate-ammonia-ligase adenylyltransferase